MEEEDQEAHQEQEGVEEGLINPSLQGEEAEAADL